MAEAYYKITTDDDGNILTVERIRLSEPSLEEPIPVLRGTDDGFDLAYPEFNGSFNWSKGK